MRDYTRNMSGNHVVFTCEVTVDDIRNALVEEGIPDSDENVEAFISDRHALNALAERLGDEKEGMLEHLVGDLKDNDLLIEADEYGE